MKAGYITTVGWFFLCSVTLLWSCIRDGDSKSSRSYHVTVRAIDSDYEDISDNVSLYFFDEVEKLDKVVKCNLDVELDIEGSLNNDHTVIALGFSADVRQPVVALGTPISEARIVLPTSTFAGQVVAASPGDLFYGRLETKDDCKNVREVLWIRRKVASLTIITHNLQAALNTTDEDFTYLVRQTYGSLGFDGDLEGELVTYHPPSHFNPTNHDLVAPLFYTYPLLGKSGFCIDIYKGTSLIKTYCADRDENPLLLKEGKHTVVLIDFNNAGNEGLLDVTCTVKDWVNNDINEGFN